MQYRKCESIRAVRCPELFFQKSLDLALNCNAIFPVRRQGYDDDPGVCQAVRMQYANAAVL